MIELHDASLGAKPSLIVSMIQGFVHWKTPGTESLYNDEHARSVVHLCPKCVGLVRKDSSILCHFIVNQIIRNNDDSYLEKDHLALLIHEVYILYI